MPLASARFAVVMLAALSLSVALGQLLQLPARRAWDQYVWIGATAQGGFFSLSGPLGTLLQLAALFALVVLAGLIRRRGATGLRLTIAAALLFAFGFIVWWLLVYPVSLELAKWASGPVPADWTHWRARWEWGQATNGLSQLAGFAALIASLLAMQTVRNSRK